MTPASPPETVLFLQFSFFDAHNRTPSPRFPSFGRRDDTMQQTEIYKLNLIESTDTFSPAPLNSNAQTVEDALADHAAQLASHNMSLAQLAIDDLQLSTGSYTGNGTCGSDHENKLNFQFMPKLVMIMGETQFCLFLRGFRHGLGHNCGATVADRYVQNVTWSGNSLSWHISETNGTSGPYETWPAHQFNASNTTYHYLAIG